MMKQDWGKISSLIEKTFWRTKDVASWQSVCPVYKKPWVQSQHHIKPDEVVHTCHPSTVKVERGKTVQGHPQLCPGCRRLCLQVSK